MRLALLKAPLLLVLYQAAPVVQRTDSTGSLQFKFGYGGGQFESASYGCNGELLSTTAIPYSAVGGGAEYWSAGNDLRVSVSGGITSISNGAAYDANGLPTNERSTTPFGSGQLAVEGHSVGIGFGLARTPFSDHGSAPGTRPSYYLRLGNRDGVHFRIDSYYPTFAPGATGDALRFGVGMNRTARKGSSGFAGLSASPYGGNGGFPLGVFGELDVPVSERFAISTMASVRPSEERLDMTGGVGFRYTLGRRTPP